MSRDINLCHPELQEKAKRLVAEGRKKGLIIKIGECFRSVAEQDALYAKGRTAPGSIVTNAKGYSFSSMHQWGVAFDVIRNDGKGAYYDGDGWFTKVGRLGKSLGLEWGGDWTSPVDKPHFQLKNWGSTPRVLKKWYGTFDDFKKTWKVEKVDEMTEAEVKKIAGAVAKAEATEICEKQKEKVYNALEEVPEWGKATIAKLIKEGALKGDGKGLALSADSLKIFVILDRMGLLDK